MLHVYIDNYFEKMVDKLFDNTVYFKIRHHKKYAYYTTRNISTN